MRYLLQNKKTSLLVILPIIALLFALPIASVNASKQNSKNFAELVWGDGNLYSMVAPPSPLPHPGAPQGQEDFYEEAPQVPSMGFPASYQQTDCTHLGLTPGTTNIPCFHDHTLGSVPGDPGFRALWHVFLVVCLGNQPSATAGSSSCTAETVTGVPLGGSSPITLNLAGSIVIDGTPTPLTSDSAINAAVGAGVVTIVDTGVTFICPVQLYSG